MGTARNRLQELRFGARSASSAFQAAACAELVRKASVSCSLQLLRPRQEVKHAWWSFIHSHLEFHLSCTPRHFQVLASKRKSLCERDTKAASALFLSLPACPGPTASLAPLLKLLGFQSRGRKQCFFTPVGQLRPLGWHWDNAGKGWRPAASWLSQS